MKVSEKQIMNLISIANMYRSYLIELKNNNMLTDESRMSMDQVGKFLSDIYNQQSDELMDI